MTFEDRVITKLDKISDDVTDLCVRVSVLENSYRTHVDEQVSAADKKFKIIAVIFGLISAVTTVTNLVT